MSAFRDFDQRRYRTVGVREGYRDWLPYYEETVEDEMDLALLEGLRQVDWRVVRKAADLGCGTGRTGAWLRERGVNEIIGVDLTSEMLAEARRREVYASLVEADVRATGLEDGSFDLVTMVLVDEHLSDLAPAYAEAARLLRSAGHHVVVGYHPYFIMAAGMPTHFDHPSGETVAIETHLHLFADHVEAAGRAGLVLVELRERVIDDRWIALKPKWERYRGVPISFAAAWRASHRPEDTSPEGERNMSSKTFDLERTYLHLRDGGGATKIGVTPTFWKEVMAGERSELGEGRLVAVFRFESDWTSAERHPAGDELVYVLTGAITLVLQEPGGRRAVDLDAGKGCLVPRGVWHTARVRSAATVLHVTPGAGTEHRPV